MTETTIPLNLLIELKLHGMRQTFDTRISQARQQEMSHHDYLSMVLQDEAEYRRNARIRRLLKRAAFRQPATLEDFDFATSRGLDRQTLNNLAGCRFILDGAGVIILGPTGVGKTFLAQAIGNTACRNGYSTLFYRMNALIEQLLLARAKATYLNLLKRLAACDLLILDDFGIKPLTPVQFQDIYDVIDERGEEKSTIVTTQVPVENWNEIIADPVTCEAITDRLASRSTRLHMKGASYRKMRGTAQIDKKRTPNSNSESQDGDQ